MRGEMGIRADGVRIPRTRDENRTRRDRRQLQTRSPERRAQQRRPAQQDPVTMAQHRYRGHRRRLMEL